MNDVTIHLTGQLNPRENWEARDCSIAHAMDVVGSRSAILLLREAFYGTSRFDDFATRVGISEAVAATRLRELVELGLLAKRPYKEAGQRTRLEYELTDMGADFFPVLVSLLQWGDRWLGESPVALRHQDCGADVVTTLRCSDGHEVALGAIDLVARDPRA